MKKAILNVKLNVPNDFECGNCKRCPLSSLSYYDDFYTHTEEYVCKIGYNETTCPLELSSEVCA